MFKEFTVFIITLKSGTPKGIGKSSSANKLECGILQLDTKIIFLLPLEKVSDGQTASDKGKAVPLQTWSGPKGSRKLRFPHFMTTALDGSKVVSLTHQLPLSAGNAPSTHFC